MKKYLTPIIISLTAVSVVSTVISALFVCEFIGVVSERIKKA